MLQVCNVVIYLVANLNKYFLKKKNSYRKNTILTNAADKVGRHCCTLRMWSWHLFIDLFQSSQISLVKVDVDVGGKAAHFVLELIYHTFKTPSIQ